jgi:hypothetical protein
MYCVIEDNIGIMSDLNDEKEFLHIAAPCCRFYTSGYHWHAVSLGMSNILRYLGSNLSLRLIGHPKPMLLQ